MRLRRGRSKALLLIALLLIAWTPREGVVHAINEKRVAHGCHRLTETGDALIADAKQHSVAMATVGRLFHSELNIGTWSLVGEVVGVAVRWQRIVTLLFESPTHRRILLTCTYDRVAVGLYRTSSFWLTGRLYAE
jgi:uncharacterized protein YkwD